MHERIETEQELREKIVEWLLTIDFTKISFATLYRLLEERRKIILRNAESTMKMIDEIISKLPD